MKKMLVGFVKLYQKYISAATPRSCRYHPTCSAYMIDAVTYHGAFKGSIMGIARICRCHPFIHGGIDYVPKHFTVRKNKDEHYPGPY